MRVTDRIAREILRLTRKGVSAREVERRLMLRTGAARRVLRRAATGDKLADAPEVWTPASIARLQLLLDSGLPAMQCQPHFPGASYSSVRNAARKYCRAPAPGGTAPREPRVRRGGCDQHLRLIAAANNGMGFPYLPTAPTYRVAA